MSARSLRSLLCQITLCIHLVIIHLVASSAISFTEATSSSSFGVGQYIALGLGASPTVYNTASSTSGVALPTPSSFSSYLNFSRPLGTSLTSNSTDPSSICQTSWDNYWNQLGDWQMGYTAATVHTLNSTVYSWPEIVTSIPLTTTTVYAATSTETYTITQTESKPTTIITQTYTRTQQGTTMTEDSLVWSTTPKTAYFETTDYAVATVPSPVTPSCFPPTNSAACSSSWSSWSTAVGNTHYWWFRIQGNPTPFITSAATLPTPACTQAPLASSECHDVQSSYIANTFDMADYYGNQEPHNRYKSLAPGCAIGCWSCTLKASTVQVLYWPSTQQAGNWSFTAHNISTVQPATALFESTTLTSPTVYLAFTGLRAANLCSGVGSTITSGVVPIDQHNLTLIYPVDQTSGLAPANDQYLTSKALPFSAFIDMQANNFTNFYLSLPPPLTTADLAFASCALDKLGA